MTLSFFFLLAAGLLMICLEIFLPGGVIGSLGAMSLAGSIVIGFYAFGPVIGMYILLGAIALLCACIILWIKYFPKTAIGRSMTLASDGKDFKSSGDHLRGLVGKDGESLTELRPAGKAMIEGVKHDVISEGSLIEKGRKVRVVKVIGNRIMVRETNIEEDSSP